MEQSKEARNKYKRERLSEGELMNEQDFRYHWENLESLDPDQLVSDLGLSTEDILTRFRDVAEDFIEKEFG